MSLESIGERQLRLANKEVNRPRYQKEAYARNQLGITIGDIRDRNMNKLDKMQLQEIKHLKLKKQ